MNLYRGEFELERVSSYTHRARRLRQGVLVFLCIIILDAVIELQTLPKALYPNYFPIKLAFQLAPLAVLICLSYFDWLKHRFEMTTFTTMIVVNSSFFVSTLHLFNVGQYHLGFEEIVINMCVALFLINLQRYYAIGYIALTLAGFAWMVYGNPELTQNKPSSTLANLCLISITCLIGRLRIDRAFNRFDFANKQLLKQGSTDHLTGLLSRRPFETRVENILSSAIHSRLPIAIFMMDIDHFKQYNDKHGHQLGDELLRATAISIKNVFQRRGDIVCRYGGDEFVAAATNISRELAEDFAVRLINDPKRFRSSEIPIDRDHTGLSVGIYCCTPTPETTAKELIQKADSALYQAKAAGRNRYIIFQEKNDAATSA